MLKYKTAIKQTTSSMKSFLPILIGIIFLISLLSEIVSSKIVNYFLTGNDLLDSFTMSLLGSIMAGNPTNSYVIASQLSAWGVGLVAIIAFIVTWVTVGIVQLPAEMLFLGKKFAILRNIFSFFSAIAIAFLATFILKAI